MIDYSETIIALQTGRNKLTDLLLKRKYELAMRVVEDLIVDLIDLKCWLRNQIEDNK